MSEKLLEAIVLGMGAYFNEFVPPGIPIGPQGGDKKKKNHFISLARGRGKQPFGNMSRAFSITKTCSP